MIFQERSGCLCHNVTQQEFDTNVGVLVKDFIILLCDISLTIVSLTTVMFSDVEFKI